VKPLAAPPPRVAIPPPPTTDLRTVTGVAPGDARASEVTAALARAGTSRPSLWGQLFRWLARRIALREQAATGSSLATLSWLDRLRSRMATALWNSRLGRALGRRHAEYLRRVLDMFDRGDLDDALRHAIPLRTGEGASRLGIGVPRPRDNLSLTYGARRAGSTIPVADAAMGMMRQRYRAAAERLEQAGRIDEAAFVLAELLGDLRAAIALLERHGRFTVAARLAEGRDLEPGLIVRLWFLAGDRERALDTARRYHAWADAIARLERSGDERAPVLRMLWADHLASMGDFVTAVEAAWPVEASRGLVEAWIDRGLALEGTAAARLLVKKLVVAPHSFSTTAPAMLAVLGSPDGARDRMAMIEELLRSPASPELQTIARPAVRALLRDASIGDIKADVIDRLVKFADDASLRADRPAIPARSQPPDRTMPVELTWSSHDGGALAVHDAALLPGDRLLLALGELGVRIIGRTGRTIAHIDQPATRLVVSDHGSRALALIPRGQVHRIARLDLATRRATYWCDAELDSGATTFDGDLWIAARGRDVFAVDTHAVRWRAVWGIAVDPATARCSVRRDGDWFVIEADDDGELEHWHYQRFTLRARKSWPKATGRVAVPAWMNERPFVAADDVLEIELSRNITVVSRRTDTGLALTAHMGDRPDSHLRLDGARTASMRLTGTLVTIADDRGRVIVFDIDRGVVRRDLRTS
jgi:hypothetical protein